MRVFKKSWVCVVSLLTRLSHIVVGLTHGTLTHHVRQTHESRAAAAAIVSYSQVTRTHQAECTHRSRAAGLTFRYATSHYLSCTSTVGSVHEVCASTNFAIHHLYQRRRLTPFMHQRVSCVSKFAWRPKRKTSKFLFLLSMAVISSILVLYVYA